LTIESTILDIDKMLANVSGR